MALTKRELLVAELAGEIDGALAAVEKLPAPERELAMKLKDAVEAFYRAGMARMVRLLRDEVAGGGDALRELASDPEVRAALAAVGILRAGPSERASRALAAEGERLQELGGRAELVRVDPPVAYVRLLGGCGSCSGGTAELVAEVERILVERVEEVAEVRIFDDGARQVPVALGSTSRWIEGPELVALVASPVLAFEAGETSLIAVAAGDGVSVFVNACAHQGMPLDRASVDPEGILHCPWHGYSYDAASGECLSLPGSRLARVSSKVDGGRIWIKGGR